jgi:hypothetical protein
MSASTGCGNAVALGYVREVPNGSIGGANLNRNARQSSRFGNLESDNRGTVSCQMIRPAFVNTRRNDRAIHVPVSRQAVGRNTRLGAMRPPVILCGQNTTAKDRWIRCVNLRIANELVASYRLQCDSLIRSEQEPDQKKSRSRVQAAQLLGS